MGISKFGTQLSEKHHLAEWLDNRFCPVIADTDDFAQTGSARRRDVVVISIRTCRHTPRGYVRTTYSAQEIDGVAAWCADTNECYFIPIADVDGQGYLHLRLAPARNNQELLVHWAADYRLGAIAQLGERLTGSQEVGGSSPPSSTPRGPP